MKTTNYEISKQLAEAGFKAEAHHKLYCFKENTLYSYYDLETILEALPSRINLEHKDTSKKINLSYDSIRYGENYFLVKKQKNESLVDTAARLWLKLKEKQLIK